MSAPPLPNRIADEMVEILFRGSDALSFREVLIVGAHASSVADAVSRYVEDHVGGGPTVNYDGDQLTEPRYDLGEPGADAIFLSEQFGPEDSYDFVVGVSPQLQWQTLGEERRREIASLSPHVSPTDEQVTPGALYLHQGRHVLSAGGRAVILGMSSITVDETARDTRADLADVVRDIERFSPDRYPPLDEPRAAVAIAAPEEAKYDTDERAVWADPSSVERGLARSASRQNHPISAGGIATPLSEMTVYDTRTEASSVYFDLHYRDHDGSLVYDDGDAKRGLVGYVARADLKLDEAAEIGDYAAELTLDRCIDPTALIERVIETLESVRFVFTGTATDPTGIVTRYDLNRLPVYHWLYDEFSRLEIGLRELLRREGVEISDQQVVVPSHGIGDLVPDQFANAQLSDLVTMVKHEGLESELQPAGEHDATLEDLVSLRNAVAHYNTLVHTMSDRRTLSDPERGAKQLSREVRLLRDCITSLEE